MLTSQMTKLLCTVLKSIHFHVIGRKNIKSKLKNVFFYLKYCFHLGDASTFADVGQYSLEVTRIRLIYITWWLELQGFNFPLLFHLFGYLVLCRVIVKCCCQDMWMKNSDKEACYGYFAFNLHTCKWLNRVQGSWKIRFLILN